MKTKVIVINNIKIIIILLITIIFFVCLIINIVNNKATQKNLEEKEIENITKYYNDINNNANNVLVTSDNLSENKVDFPKKIDGYKVIGKIEIPKINLTTYILEKTSKETLNKSVTKLCGPEVNEIGNLCITGHNYHKDRMFGDLKDVEKNDKILLTDLKRKHNRISYI